MTTAALGAGSETSEQPRHEGLVRFRGGCARCGVYEPAWCDLATAATRQAEFTRRHAGHPHKATVTTPS